MQENIKWEKNYLFQIVLVFKNRFIAKIKNNSLIPKDKYEIAKNLET